LFQRVDDHDTFIDFSRRSDMGSPSAALGLDDIAPVFIDVLRPFGAIGGQLLTLASPLLRHS
jgi:hypothetical protein